MLHAAIPALAAHVVNAHIPQRHDTVVSADLGIVADQESEDVWLGSQHCIMYCATPLCLVHSKGVCALLQEVRGAWRMPACIAPTQAPRSQYRRSSSNICAIMLFPPGARVSLPQQRTVFNSRGETQQYLLPPSAGGFT